jgi:DNA-binding transcriptional LysR family regulator
MVRKIDWESQIGRRLKLRDLHVFGTVVQRGSMAKAAAHLRVSQPAVSEIISDLEHTLGVRLLDRGPQGVEPTMYGRALLKGGTAAFDDLKQSIKEIELMADPTAGELRIGCSQSLGTSILPPVIEQFSRQYPRVVLRVQDAVSPTLEFPELRERRLDVVFDRLMRPLTRGDDDLNVEVLCNDDTVVAAGPQSRWARLDKVDLGDLANEPWILTAPDTWIYMIMAEAFRERGLAIPKPRLMTFSVHLRAKLVMTGPFISPFPKSFLHLNADHFPLKVLPIDLPANPWPIAVITLKHRTLMPVAQSFIDQVRAFTRSFDAEWTPGKGPPEHPGRRRGQLKRGVLLR